MAVQDLSEDNRVVVFGVPGGVLQGEDAVACPPAEFRESRASATKLFDVAAAKLLEAARLVPEPLPELRARRQLPLPLIELGPLARDPARPRRSIRTRWPSEDAAGS